MAESLQTRPSAIIDHVDRERDPSFAFSPVAPSALSSGAPADGVVYEPEPQSRWRNMTIFRRISQAVGGGASSEDSKGAGKKEKVHPKIKAMQENLENMWMPWGGFAPQVVQRPSVAGRGPPAPLPFTVGAIDESHPVVPGDSSMESTLKPPPVSSAFGFEQFNPDGSIRSEMPSERSSAAVTDAPILKAASSSPITQDASSFDENFQGPMSPTSWMDVLNPNKPLARSSVKSSIYALVTAMIGGGSLSIPYAVKSSGLIGGAFLFVLLAYLTAYSCQLILAAAHHTNLSRPTYSEIAREAAGPWAEKLTKLMFIVATLLASIAYVTLEASILPSVAAIIGNCDVCLAKEDSTNCCPWYAQDRFLSGVVAVFAVPVGAVHQVGALKFTSLLCLISVLFFALIVVIKSFQLADADWTKLTWFNVSSEFFSGFSIVSTSFFCHFTILPVQFELRKPSSRRRDRLLAKSVMLVFAIYFVVGIAGYVTFVDDLKSNVFLNYNDGDILVAVARAMFAITVFCALPLLVYPCRSVLESMVFKEGDIYKPVRAFLVASCIIAVVYVVAATRTDISIYWGFFGAFCCNLIAFVLPPFFYLRLRKKPVMYDTATKKAGVLFLFGIFAVISCTSVALKNLVKSICNGKC